MDSNYRSSHGSYDSRLEISNDLGYDRAIKCPFVALHPHGKRPAQVRIGQPLSDLSRLRAYLRIHLLVNSHSDRCHSVMGATGSGKTSVSSIFPVKMTGNSSRCPQFINLASGSGLRIGMGLESCTAKVQLANQFALDGRPVTLIDTPGFDDTIMSDTDVLKMIAAFLAMT